MHRLWSSVVCALMCLNLASAQWGDFFERDFPFHCSTLDAREVSPGNLTPRAIVVHLDGGYHAAFDPDLGRIAMIWKQRGDAEFLTRVAMAPGSYSDAGRKAPGGQRLLPAPVGEIVAETGRYPGWYVGELPGSHVDPRPPAPDPEEVGLGPLPLESYLFGGLRFDATRPSDSLVFHYKVAGVAVTDRLVVSQNEIQRRITVGPRNVTFYCLSERGREPLRFGPSQSQSQRVLRYPLDQSQPLENLGRFDWRQPVITKATTVREGVYTITRIGAPMENPWRRNVRIAALDFFSNGDAAVSTFDGDVWIVSGLHLDGQRWRRFASGLNEPMGLQIVDERIYVSGRTGIWRLHDENGDGIADRYECFSNQVAQTAETREFPMGFVKKPGGGFYISKGGQVGTSRGLYNGTVIEISPDGRAFEVIARGLRQPFIGIDPKSGQVTASDQQGNWVPATPIHHIRKGQHYGFLPTILKNAKHPEAIAEPILWLPHFANQSGASQITNYDKRFGPLTARLLHLAYNRPEIFLIYPGGNQGAASSVFSGAFDTGLLSGAVNPAGGQLYVCGFKIWGTVGKDITGLYRIQYSGKGNPEVPAQVRCYREGILIRFHFPADEAVAGSFASYDVDRWNYVRSSSYGSGNYKLDGTPGQETMQVSSIYISADKRSVFLGIPGMKPVQQMRLTYRVPVASGAALPKIHSVYLTVYSLKEADMDTAGFGPATVDLSPRKEAAGETHIIPTEEEGEKLSTLVGCVACHSTDGTQGEKVGPTWLGLYGAKRTFTDGTTIKNADEFYLRESILNPARRVTVAYDGEGVGMPPYLGVLKDHQVESIILYIKSLKPN